MKHRSWTVHSTRLWAIPVAIASCFVALTQPGCTCRVGGESFGEEYEDVLVPTSGYTGRSFAAQFRQVTSLEKGLIPASRVYTSPFDPRWLFIRDTVLATCGTIMQYRFTADDRTPVLPMPVSQGMNFANFGGGLYPVTTVAAGFGIDGPIDLSTAVTPGGFYDHAIALDADDSCGASGLLRQQMWLCAGLKLLELAESTTAVDFYGIGLFNSATQLPTTREGLFLTGVFRSRKTSEGEAPRDIDEALYGDILPSRRTVPPRGVCCKARPGVPRA